MSECFFLVAHQLCVLAEELRCCGTILAHSVCAPFCELLVDEIYRVRGKVSGFPNYREKTATRYSFRYSMFS
jgi:hypothetical protein